MSTMTIEQAIQAAEAGGFTPDHGLRIIVAVGWAESRWVTDARHTNADGSIDRGWLQINSVHTDISDAACDDPILAATYAFTKLSKGGTVFTPWSAYTSGAYKGPEGLVWTLVWQAVAAMDRAAQIKALQLQLDAEDAKLGAALEDLNNCKGQVATLTGQLAACALKIQNAKDALA